MRRRAAFIRQHAYCPHHEHRPARLPANPKDPAPNSGNQPPAHVDFECPDCGVPVYCSEGHWAEDYETHLEICDTLRQINEDDHDLRSGRFFPEFEYAGPQMEEAAINMTNWDTFLYTRQFEAINHDRSMRQVTRLLTYPLTIGSILHELSPYSIRKGGRLTPEGLKSLSALRYTLHPPKTGGGTDVKGLRPEAPPVRIFILGARAESSLPRNVWVQLAHMFPRGKFHLIFIGPESMANRDDEFPLPPRTPSNPFGAVVEDRVWPTMKISTIVDYYHTLHKTGQFYPYDPYFDCFVMFHPGLGHPASSHEWSETVPLLLETKAPIIATGYTQYDMERDIEWVRKTCHGEFDMLMEPGENTFRSLRWDLNDLDPQDVSCGNWGVWAFRGKRYEATRREVEEAKPEPPAAVVATGLPTSTPTASDSLPPDMSAPDITPGSSRPVSPGVNNMPPRSPVSMGGSSAPAPPPVPSQPLRRAARPGSADFLSDKATAALIRRTLCARQLGSADRDRGTPAPIEDLLPPLTSRNDVDLQLYALISIIIREFVQTWYAKITPDETFVAEIIQIIAHCTRALEQRLRKVDLESLLFDELPELLDAHIRAYRAAKNSAVRPPIEANPHDVYHSLFPLPALSPVPRPDDSKSILAQAENERTYRQLLAQGLLAILLPTEDLENSCLTALVGEILSELVIGNLIANRISEPWLIWEGLIIITRLAHKGGAVEPSRLPTPRMDSPPGPGRNSVSQPSIRRSWSLHRLFWAIVQWGFLAVHSIRFIIGAAMLSRSLPPRSKSGAHHMGSTDHSHTKESCDPPTSLETQRGPVKVPIAEFYIWSCVANLLELDVRMPWLTGALSMGQWAAMKGPGKLAGLNGGLDSHWPMTLGNPGASSSDCTVESAGLNEPDQPDAFFTRPTWIWQGSSRSGPVIESYSLPLAPRPWLLSHYVHVHILDPAHLPPLLRSIRAAVFPNNAPGAPGLTAPSSDEQLASLRRRCAKAFWALMPKGLGRLYYGSSAWPWFNIPVGNSRSEASTNLRFGPFANSGNGNSNTDRNVSDTGKEGTCDHDPVPPGDKPPPIGEQGAHSTPHVTRKLRPAAGRTGEQSAETSRNGSNHNSDGEAAPYQNDNDGGDEERILSEIETGIIDVFSDTYCNKHLMYGILELILVRLMPELAEKGVIELLEERLS
ncbi:hypothetical protein DL771_000090 [Monosporascus sp. 5C6A]|nr:hypothetical protein DL771_000090 [Monosporascus sp. 5C6A]